MTDLGFERRREVPFGRMRGLIDRHGHEFRRGAIVVVTSKGVRIRTTECGDEDDD